MYSIPAYVAMITDEVRVEAYARALQAVITPQSMVVEIGTGVGVFAVMAKRMGARRVVAIEPSDAIAVARMLAADNGVHDIEFIQGLSGDVTLSERADVVLSDLRGTLPVFEGHIRSIIDARERLLAPGGVLIPAADTLYAAAVELPEKHLLRRPSRTAAAGVKLDVLKRFVANSWERGAIRAEDLVSAPVPWAVLDYGSVLATDVAGNATLQVQRSGAVHGLAVWFDATLGQGVTFTNAPGRPELVYGTAFFPWPEAVAVQPGDEIGIRISANQVGDEYIWRWDSTVSMPGGERPRAQFRQSTLQGAPFVPAKLARGAAAAVPVLNDDGRVERFVLDLIDGSTANQDIARRMLERFPSRFARFNDALGRVGSVARRFAAD